MKKWRLFYIVCVLLCCSLAVGGCSFGPHLMLWGEEPLGVSLPPADEVEVLQRIESKGRDSAQQLQLQLNDEQAAQFEQDIQGKDFWKPLPLPIDIAKFFTNYFTYTEEAEAYCDRILAVSNGYWMLYNDMQQIYVAHALTYHDTRVYVFALYNSDSKQLFIDENHLY